MIKIMNGFFFVIVDFMVVVVDYDIEILVVVVDNIVKEVMIQVNVVFQVLNK